MATSNYGYTVTGAGTAAANGDYLLVAGSTSYGSRPLYSNGTYNLGFCRDDDGRYGWVIAKTSVKLTLILDNMVEYDNRIIYYGPKLSSGTSNGPEGGTWSKGYSGTAPAPSVAVAEEPAPEMPEGERKLTVTKADPIETADGLRYFNGVYSVEDISATGFDRVWSGNGLKIFARVPPGGLTKVWFVGINDEAGLPTYSYMGDSAENPWQCVAWSYFMNSDVDMEVLLGEQPYEEGDIPGGGDDPGGGGGGDNEDSEIVPPPADPVPVNGADGLIIADYFIPSCPNPVDSHFTKVSPAGKWAALDWLAPALDEEGRNVFAGVTYFASCAGWLFMQGGETGIPVDMGTSAADLSIHDYGYRILIHAGWFYKIAADSDFTKGLFVPCKGAVYVQEETDA